MSELGPTSVFFAQLGEFAGPGTAERHAHFRGICTEGAGHPEDRGSLYHAVKIAISDAGAISGRLIQPFDRGGKARIRFGGDLDS